jgi:hypothetical protein
MTVGHILSAFIPTPVHKVAVPVFGFPVILIDQDRGMQSGRGFISVPFPADLMRVTGLPAGDGEDFVATAGAGKEQALVACFVTLVGPLTFAWREVVSVWAVAGLGVRCGCEHKINTRSVR